MLGRAVGAGGALGGLPVLPAPSRACRHGQCAFAGWQGSNPCCSSREVLAGGACATGIAAFHPCFRSLQSVPVSAQSLLGLEYVLYPPASSISFTQTITVSSRLLVPHFLVFVFVSLFQNFPILLKIPVLPIFS